jgi:uncharacterized protein YggE
MRFAIIVVLLSSTAAAQTPPAGPPVISTSGVGDVELRPDRATIVVSVETRATSASAASADASRRTRGVLDTLRTLGIEGERAATSGIEIHPEYATATTGAAPRAVGHVARTSLRLSIVDLDRVGAAIDASLAKQATSISSLEFWSTGAGIARQKHSSALLLPARADAEAMAGAAGGLIGGLLELSSTQCGSLPDG